MNSPLSDRPPPRPDRPIEQPCAWRGEDLIRRSDWIHEWSDAERAELVDAARRALRHRRDPTAIRREDFLLPRLGAFLRELRTELIDGRGFVLLRGLDPRLEPELLGAPFWGLGTHLGVALPQNADGDLLGHVRDRGLSSDDPRVRIYQTRERQGFHTDSADLVGLLCLQTAVEGGRSALVSAAALHNALLAQDPAALATLFEPFRTDHRGEHPPGQAPYFTAPILGWCEERLSILYQRRYIESAQRFPEAPRLDASQLAALDALDRAAEDPALHLQMDLRPGDVQFIHNHALLHDRTAFRDGPGQRRHLLRLWLCPEVGRALPAWFAERLGSVQVGRRGGVRTSAPPPAGPAAAPGRRAPPPAT